VGAEAAFDARDPDLPAKSRHSPMAWESIRRWQSQSKAFFQALDCTRRVVKFSFAEFPDQVEIPINPNILYRREIDLMGL